MFRSAFVLGLAAAVAMALVLSPSADAAKGGKPKNPVVPSISLDQTDVHLGDWVTFTYSAPVDEARIQVVCSQDGAVVYGEAGPAGQAFKLGGGWSPWLVNGGAADCEATLYSWDFHPRQTFVYYASMTFHAEGAR